MSAVKSGTENRRRAKTAGARLSDVEMDALVAHCFVRRVSVSEFVRGLILESLPAVVATP